MTSKDKNLKSAENFKLRLAQTIAWCGFRVDISNVKDCLRTPEFRPSVFERDRFSAVDSVADRRKYRLGRANAQQLQIPKDLGG